MDRYEGPSNKIEILDNIFMADKGTVKILLLKKETEPYKGYWSLPRTILYNNESVEECAVRVSYELTGLKEISFEENAVFSNIDRIPDERVIGISCIGFTDTVTVSLKQEEAPFEYGWFEIERLPKLLHDHNKIANKAILDLQTILLDFESLRKLFPSDFTLPEIQKVYEQVLGYELDRRNFRKKLVSLDVLEATGENNIGESGRPAKLYRFKENLDHKKMF